MVLRNGKLRLTEWANAHVDACCLRFVRSYYRDNRTRYVYGQLNSDEEYNGRGLALSMEQGYENVLMAGACHVGDSDRSAGQFSWYAQGTYEAPERDPGKAGGRGVSL